MQTEELYFAEALVRALEAYAARSAFEDGSLPRKVQLVADAAAYLAQRVQDHQADPGLDDLPLQALVVSLSRDLGILRSRNAAGGSGTSRNPEPDVMMPSLKGLADATRFAEEAFPPDDRDLDL